MKSVEIEAKTAEEAIQKACDGDGVIRPVGGQTVADSISVSLPRDGRAAVRAVRESGGFAVTVSDAEILAAIPALARMTVLKSF